MSFAGLTTTWQSAGYDMTDVVVAEFVAVRPVEITRWGVVHTVALTTTAGLLTSAVLAADGTAAVPGGAAAGGTLTLPVATVGLANKGAYIEADDFVDSKPITLVPGEKFTIVSDGLPATGTASLFVEMRELPFQDITRPEEGAGYSEAATTLAALTKLTA